MGIVLSAFITATCLSSLLWFVLPLLSQLSLVDMLLLADMLPTLPELSMMQRDPLMLSQRLMLMPLFCTEPTDMVLTHMLEPTVPTHMPMELTHMPTELTTERDLLMPSQRLMLMPLFCMELTDMVPTHTPMELTHTPMDTDTDTHMPTESTESKLFLSRKY